MTEIARLKVNDIIFVFIDLQKKLLDAIDNRERVVASNILLLEAAKVLNVPYIVTTQYKKGLGELWSSFAGHIADPALDKTTFSCLQNSSVQNQLNQMQKPWVVLSGIETHICVLQTCLDLLSAGRNVAVVTDAVAARHMDDHQLGLRRMEKSGALLVTKEMLIYEILGRSDAEAFKKLLPLIKNS
ncbi:MAG TPA: isochorismatase family protein [Acidobacteriota bacterium]|nr:isochorismatase family protein [Acidobacteriota bacterium]